ncbi:MAG: hypothetical protein FWE84_04145 [Firmicutes bacterium]|nr:hypothetical protein [Bacillota bacterium]
MFFNQVKKMVEPVPLDYHGFCANARAIQAELDDVSRNCKVVSTAMKGNKVAFIVLGAMLVLFGLFFVVGGLVFDNEIAIEPLVIGIVFAALGGLLILLAFLVGGSKKLAGATLRLALSKDRDGASFGKQMAVQFAFGAIGQLVAGTHKERVVVTMFDGINVGDFMAEFPNGTAKRVFKKSQCAIVAMTPGKRKPFQFVTLYKKNDGRYQR